MPWSTCRSGAILLLTAALMSPATAAVPRTRAAKPGGTSPVRPPVRPAADCASLAGMMIPAASIRLPTHGAVVTKAEQMPPSGTPDSPDYLPAYCNVRGTIAPLDPAAPVINFGVALPADWNGRSIQIGGNGMLGFVPFLAALNRNGAGSPQGPTYPLGAPYPLAQGYATFGDDSGHVTGTGAPPGQPGGVPPSAGQATMGGPPPGAPNFGWVANREAWLNFAYQHVRKDHDASFAVIRAYYHAAPRTSYFFGESHGGRESMEAAGRYGDDYDGVFLSVPLAYLTELWLRDLRNQRAQAVPGGFIPAAKLPAIERAVQAQCDALDGRVDGVVQNYAACDAQFDPTRHPRAMAAIRCPDGKDGGADCLSDAQIATVDAFRSPVALPYAIRGLGSVYPSAVAGSEATNNWIAARTPPDPDSPTSGGGALALMRPLFGKPGLTLANFDPQLYRTELKAMSDDLDPPTDWSRLFAHGGKVIWHSAANDYLTNSAGHVAAYRAVVAQSTPAAITGGLRFYVTPGGDHGSRSFSFPARTPQPRQMNLIGLLEAWVENGTPPPAAVDQVLTDPVSPFARIRSRPLCLFPRYPRYTGGDGDVAASYRCTAP